MTILGKGLAAGLLVLVGISAGHPRAAAIDFGDSDLSGAVLRTFAATLSVPNDPDRARDVLKFTIANLILQPGDRLCIGASLASDRGGRSFGIGDASSEDGTLYCEMEEKSGGKLASSKGEDLDGFACKAKYSPRNGGLLKLALARWFIANLLLFPQVDRGRDSHAATLFLTLYVFRSQQLCWVTMSNPVFLYYRVLAEAVYRAKLKTVRAE